MIHVLDTLQLGRPGIVAATAVETADGVILFDTGAESTFEHLAAGLRKIGAEAEDVRHVFVSHIHLDHAGAAWRFAELGATIYVHPRGAPHLINPAKLVESATRIFGAEMERLWGRIAPIPPQRVRVLQNLEAVRVGKVEVHAIETPGHATHHHIYHWDDNLFGGDVAGVRLGAGAPIPPFVPPELHIESWLESIDKILGVGASKLYLPHFGAVEDSILSHCDALEERVRRWSTWFRDRIRASDDEPRLVPDFAEYEARDLMAGGATEELVRDYEAADPSSMAVTASLRYWRKYHPDALSMNTSLG